MHALRKLVAGLALVTFVVAGGQLYAQSGGKDGKGKKADAVTMPMTKTAKISANEMARNATALIGEMQVSLKRVVGLQQVARKQKDVIKLNCVNDKLLQVKKLLNIAESSRTDLTEDIANSNEPGRYHNYTKITISKEKVVVLRDEAEACIGEELSFVGPTKVDVDAPPVVDDPTRDDPFTVDNPDLERPNNASPFY